jgi:phosphatidate cytidylyltransferase
MLRDRLLTAAILVPLVVLGVLWLPTTILAVLLALLVLLAGYELTRLAGIQQRVMQTGVLLVLALFMGLLYPHLQAAWWFSVQLLTTLWWLVVSVVLVLRRQAIQVSGQNRPGVLVLGCVLLLVAWASMLYIHAMGQSGPYVLLFLLVLIWSADSGAYFAGRAWGKRRLAPVVSPGKTWTGVAGATVAAIICAFVFWHFVDMAARQGILLVCVWVAWLSIGGDLWESLLKRQAGMKDSGHLLPGHGGVLDRIDSLLAAAPAFTVGLAWLGYSA